MNKELELKSPAKLNLYLKVLNRRPDGYHNIVTVFERISLCDDVILRAKREGIAVKCSNPDVPDGKKNIAYKAAALLKEYADVKAGVRIDITKRIPHGAGLGGGSSNAAAVLKGLNVLWGLKLKKQKLMRLGSEIGADVGFFLSDSRVGIGRGLGDSIRKIKGTRRLWHVLVVPEKRLLTRDVYRRYDLARTPHPNSNGKSPLPIGERDRVRGKFPLTDRGVGVKILCHALKGRDIRGIAERLYNDLEEAASLTYSNISHIKTALNRCNCRGSLMSGSGSAVFGIFTGRKEAMRVKSKLRGMLGPGQFRNPRVPCQIIVVYTL